MRRGWIIGLGVLLLDAGLFAWWLASREPPGPPTVSGVVLDPDGNPVRAGVWRLPWMQQEPHPWGSDEDGRFVVPLASGRFGLCARGPLLWAESEALYLDSSDGRSIDDVVLRLQRPARVRGQILDETGEPLASIMVICVSGSLVANDTEPIGYTDAEGRFAFDDCDPGRARIRGHRFFLPEGETTDVLLRYGDEEAGKVRERRR